MHLAAGGAYIYRLGERRWCLGPELHGEAEQKFAERMVCGVRVQSWINLVAYAVNLGVTYGSLTGAFGKTNTELSEKYQTLVTPAGYAFSIWGPIFIWEGVFAVAQMFPTLGSSAVVETMTPWWICACCFQVAWTVFFAQEIIPVSLACMLGILLSLLIGILRTDYLPDISVKEYFLLRAPFSLHSGWIIAASALNTNVVSLCTIAVLVALFALAAPRADPIIPLVACWALLGIFNELGNPENLMNDAKWNFIDWPHWVLEAVRQTALVLSVASAVGAAVAIVRSVWTCKAVKRQKSFMADTGHAEI
ncbi:Uncharacterized protein SCF082_LOCUS18297 [Durusdinium trenchii]|uniref:Uncharacterized protein n=1 Tax=Durusdinium trenchii TaxID=1381693 RepID=A0ABP0KPB1_9DINO